jgi:hypothetical protein
VITERDCVLHCNRFVSKRLSLLLVLIHAVQLEAAREEQRKLRSRDISSVLSALHGVAVPADPAAVELIDRLAHQPVPQVHAP